MLFLNASQYNRLIMRSYYLWQRLLAVVKTISLYTKVQIMWKGISLRVGYDQNGMRELQKVWR